MTDLVVTGPPALDLRWGQQPTDRDGRLEREFYPGTELQEAEGFLHPGVAAAAALGAAHLAALDTRPVTSVGLSVAEPIPLGDRLVASVSAGGDGSHDVAFERILPPDYSDVSLAVLARAAVRFAGREPAPDLDDVRQLAIVPLPDDEEHELFAGCWVCGQDNPRGLQLLPRWHAEGRVVSRLLSDDRYREQVAGEDRVSPLVVSALLSCPTLWAVKHQLDAAGLAAALLSDYEVRFHADPPTNSALRTVGFAGQPEGVKLHGVSALVGEDGEVYATASGHWFGLEEAPSREPGRPTPRRQIMPEKAGRPEERSTADWGVTLPGRREAPGPRSEPPAEE